MGDRRPAHASRADSTSAWIVAGLAAVIAAFTIRKFPTSSADRSAARNAPRITWRREYKLYYVLTFLDGSRQQIYFAFAPFVLVEHFNLNAFYLTAILIAAAVINWRMGSVIGRFVDRKGEKRVLLIGYTMHLAVFLGFALAPNVWIASIALSWLQLSFTLFDRNHHVSQKNLPARGPCAESGDGRVPVAPDRDRRASRRRRALDAARLPIPVLVWDHLRRDVAVRNPQDRCCPAACDPVRSDRDRRYCVVDLSKSAGSNPRTARRERFSASTASNAIRHRESSQCGSA